MLLLLLLLLGVMVIFEDWLKAVGRSVQLIVILNSSEAWIVFERQLAISVVRSFPSFVGDFRCLVGDLGDWRRLVGGLRVAPVGRNGSRGSVPLWVILVLVLVAVGVVDAGRKVFVARALNADTHGHSVRKVLGVILRLESLTLSSEATWSPAEAAFLEHVLTRRINGPVVTLAGSAETLGQLDEALVQTQVVPHRVLPTLVGSSEEGESLLEEGVDLREGESLARTGLNGHHYEGNVRVGWLLLPPGSSLPGGVAVRARQQRVHCLRLTQGRHHRSYVASACHRVQVVVNPRRCRNLMLNSRRCI